MYAIFDAEYIGSLNLSSSSMFLHLLLIIVHYKRWVPDFLHDADARK